MAISRGRAGHGQSWGCSLRGHHEGSLGSTVGARDPGGRGQQAESGAGTTAVSEARCTVLPGPHPGLDLHPWLAWVLRDVMEVQSHLDSNFFI